jgi:hypothetical protein
MTRPFTSLFILMTMAFGVESLADWPGVRLTRPLTEGVVPGIPGEELIAVSGQAPWMANEGIAADGSYLEFGEKVDCYFFGGISEMEPAYCLGDPVAGIPADWTVSYWNLRGLSEQGVMAFRAEFDFPGVDPPHNGYGVIGGVPGDVRAIMLPGDPAPEFSTGVIPTIGSAFFDIHMADDGTLLVHLLTMDIIDGESQPFVSFRVGDVAGTAPIAWTGMPAPGMGEGIRFRFLSSVLLSDGGVVAFRGGLMGPGVEDDNDIALYVGTEVNLVPFIRYGDPAPGFGSKDITVRNASLKGVNPSGDVSAFGTVEGPGVDGDYERVIWAGQPGALHIVAHQGDPLPGAEASIVYDLFSYGFINADRKIILSARAVGEGVDESNDNYVLYGPYDAPEIVLRDGDLLPNSEEPFQLDGFRNAVLSDEGQIALRTNWPSSSYTGGPDASTLMSPDGGRTWRTVIRNGDVLDGRTVLTVDYRTLTGGSDGAPQPMNDRQQLGLSVEFTDGTEHAYLAELFATADADLDGDTDLSDFGAFQICFSGSGGEAVTNECATAFDFDFDGDVDLSDFAEFQLDYTGPL